jgi:hypothetical protein
MKIIPIFFVLLIISLTITPVLAADPSSQMTDPVSFILNLLKNNKGQPGEPGITTTIVSGNGTEGPQGPPGPTGLTGPMNQTANMTPGAAAEIWVNNTFTLPNGTDANVINIGNSLQAELDFYIPRGIKGDKGDTGLTGPMNQTANMTAGSKGDTGAQGDKGDKGDTGEHGDKGDTGEQGPPGTTNYLELSNLPDLTQFLWLNGSRSMTGNLSMGSKYINNLFSGTLGTDAVNKSYVDSKPIYNASYWTGTNYNSSYQTSTYNSTYAGHTTLLQVYPVGSIYISVTNTNPGTIFGGTWATFGNGRVLVGNDTSQLEFDTVKETGGAKTNSTVITHTHDTTHMVGTTDGTYGTFDSSSTTPGTSKVLTSAAPAGALTSMSIVQPYIVVYFWERTA